MILFVTLVKYLQYKTKMHSKDLINTYILKRQLHANCFNINFVIISLQGPALLVTT